MEIKSLPKEYTYLIEERNENFLKFRIKEVTEETSVKDWIEKLSESTKTTWRIARTYPRAGKSNIYKVHLRCQHATDRRVQGVRTSKNTDCPANLQIIVKRYVKYSRSKKKDLLIKDWPTICHFKHNHNHMIESASVLKYRDLSNKSKEILFSLFCEGHGPSSALHRLKTDLLLEHGDNYYKVAADGFHVPSISVVSKLFKREFSATYGSMDGHEMLNSFDDSLSSGTDDFQKLEEHYFVAPLTLVKLKSHEIKQSDENDEAEMNNEAKVNVNVTQSTALTERELTELDDLFKRIKDGCSKHPEIFAPAVRKMLKNAKRSAATQSGLVSALCTFGQFSGAAKRSNRQSYHGQNIGVQPTSISRRKSFLSSKRKLSAGCPSSSIVKRPKALDVHDYTSLGSLPSRKQKSKHNLQDCT